MVKYYPLLWVLMIIFILPYSYAINYDDKNTVESLVTISNSFAIVPTGSSFNIKYINASLSAFPKSDSRQVVSELNTNPDADIDDTINFMFNNPIRDSYSLNVNARVITRNNVEQVSLPILFPLKELDSSLYIYTQPTDIIDVNDDMRNLASELIGDKNDLYEIEYLFAEYVRKNIAYDISTLTSSVNQKSSWVLDNRVGVCDEITNLFISLNRAAGIPARFVSGIAYTNLEEVFGSSWVSHAWAEVYYPGTGWIPYDVTYGQYGFIDAGHIKLSDSAESSSSNIDYNYLGNDVKIVPGEISTDVDVINYGENVHGLYEFDASVYADEVGFGSYDLIIVDVRNSRNYYMVADIYLADTDGMEIIEETQERVLNKTLHRKQVLLKPYHSSKVYWIVKIDGGLDKNYMYTFPITIYNTYNDTSTTFISSRKDYKSYGYEYFNEMVSSTIEESAKQYSKYIFLQCTNTADNIYLEDSVTIDCVLDNKGDVSFDSVNICIDNACTVEGLAVQKKSLHYVKNFTSEGLKNVEIKVYNDNFLKVNYIPINVLDKPSISINALDYPKAVNYTLPFEITFTLSKDSKSVPKNVKVTLKSETNKVEWSFPEFEADKSFTLKSRGETLKPNKNNYKITVYYADEKGETYTVEQEFMIVSQAKWYENILLYINLIGRSIEQAVSG
ncbi:MAG: transglutaminase-like domain-containing protein [Candidatus Woesearchaeota archaeon]